VTTVDPDAQLVMTHRDPVEVVGSACSLLRHVRPMFSDQVDLREIAAQMIETFDLMIARQNAFRDKHGKHSYSLEEFGLTADGVRSHFKDYCERYKIPLREAGAR